MSTVIGTTALSSIAAAILNGGSKEASPYRGYDDFETTWDSLVAELETWPPGMDVDLPYDLELDADRELPPPPADPGTPGALTAGGPGSGRYPKGSGGRTERVVERNLQSCLDRCKASGNLETDAAWYSTAHDQITEHAQAAGIDPATFTGMVAATSPRCLWETTTGRLLNIEMAERAAQVAKEHPNLPGKQVADSLKAPGMLRNSLGSAIDIYNGTPTEEVLQGPKVRSFYNNLTDPKGSQNVTVDTHMARAMADDPNLDDKGVREFTAGKNYAWAADRIRKIAADNNLSPLEAQAAVWTQWKRENP